ncbi:MAG: hypothetical protein LUQ32_06200 [Methanomicrobiales archaeon]|nr:hypothetical protein [Methanomicrobiales archaeon]
MVLDSLREALARMVDTPVLWITGLFMGALLALDLSLQVGGNTILGSRIGFLGLCALPFFLGGSYGAIRGGDPGLRGYLRAGARYYFRILLSGAVIVAAAFLTVFLVMIPFTFLGGSLQATMTLSLLGVAIPFAFFTFFFDTAVVFEDRKVLDSIRRSVEFVLGNPGRVVAFYLVNLAIGMLIFLVSVVIWSFTIADRLQPFMEVNQTVFQNMNMTTEQVLNLIGVSGLWAGAIIGFFTVMIGGTFLLSFKACLFKGHTSASASAAPVQGEFDEKGRWYRY